MRIIAASIGKFIEFKVNNATILLNKMPSQQSWQIREMRIIYPACITRKEIRNIVNDEADFEVLNIAFIRGGLSCNSVMAKAFYTSYEDVVCFQCGTEVTVEKTNNDTHPLCCRCLASVMKVFSYRFYLYINLLCSKVDFSDYISSKFL